MRIMHLASGRHPNGAVLHCLDLCRELSARGHDIALAHRLTELDLDRFRNQPIDLVNCDFKRWPFQKLQQFKAELEGRRIDVIHTHSSSAHFFGVLLRRLFGVPTVATAHNAFFQLHWPWNDFVIANSAATYRFQNQYNLVRKSKLKLIHCFIDVEKFSSVDREEIERQRYDWSVGSGPVIGVIGELIPRKGQLDVVRALPKIIKKYPQAKLIMIGKANRTDQSVGDYLHAIETELDREKLRDHVIFHGYSQRMDVVMNAIDVCVVPSRSEPFGLVAAEAMAARKPVIASSVGGLPDIVQDQLTGLLVPAGAPDKIAEAFDMLQSDQAFCQELVEQGAYFVDQHFGVDQQVAQIEQVYESVVSRRKFQWKNNAA